MSIKEKLSDPISRRELIKPVSAGLFGFAFLNLFKAPLSAQTSPGQEETTESGELPPIIIKSGSFIIESDVELRETAGTPRSYRRSNFMIRRVNVIKVNERTGTAIPYPFTDNQGIELDIRLQHFVNNSWQPLAQSPLAQISNERVPGSSSTNFLLRIPKDLDIKGNAKPGRKERRRTQESGNPFRFGSVVIRGTGTTPAPDIPLTVNGDDYIITLFGE
jgi:hypothetical protein